MGSFLLTDFDKDTKEIHATFLPTGIFGIKLLKSKNFSESNCSFWSSLTQSVWHRSLSRADRRFLQHKGQHDSCPTAALPAQKIGNVCPWLAPRGAWHGAESFPRGSLRFSFARRQSCPCLNGGSQPVPCAGAGRGGAAALGHRGGGGHSARARRSSGTHAR